MSTPSTLLRINSGRNLNKIKMKMRFLPLVEMTEWLKIP